MKGKEPSYNLCVKTLLVVGLGNPGKEHALTRHNLGIRVVQAWLDESREAQLLVRAWREDKNLGARVAQVSLPGVRVICLSTLDFMNDSGKAVVAAVRFLKLVAGNVVIVHDDMELPFGAVESELSGSARGHNGVRSVHEYLGTQVVTRLRLGIGRPPNEQDPSAFVLEQFTGEEEKVLTEQTIPEATTQLSGLLGQHLPIGF